MTKIQAGCKRVFGFQGKNSSVRCTMLGSDPVEVKGRSMKTPGAAAIAKQVHSNLISVTYRMSERGTRGYVPFAQVVGERDEIEKSAARDRIPAIARLLVLLDFAWIRCRY